MYFDNGRSKATYLYDRVVEKFEQKRQKGQNKLEKKSININK